MARRCLRQLALAVVLLAPAAAGAQSTDLLLAYKNFETAKAADKVSDALKFGNSALKLTEEAGDSAGLIELLRNLGEYSAQVNQDGAAAEYYGRAVALHLGGHEHDLDRWTAAPHHDDDVVERRAVRARDHRHAAWQPWQRTLARQLEQSIRAQPLRRFSQRLAPESVAHGVERGDGALQIAALRIHGELAERDDLHAVFG